MSERAACHTTGEATARAPGFIDDGRACMAWQSSRSIAAVQAIQDCVGCSRFKRAQSLGLAPRA